MTAAPELVPERWPALSLREPWLTAVLDLGKRIENRRWNTNFRGRFWLHAAKAMTRKEYDEGCIFIEEQAMLKPPVRSQLRPQGIAGCATLHRVVAPGTDQQAESTQFDEWWMPWQFGFVLVDVIKLPRVIPCVGALGFFKLPADVEEQAREMLRP